MARFGSLDAQYFDDAGDPLISGKIYFYETGTTTAKNTYADVNLAIANTNPVILTAAGRQPNIFFDGVAKAILTSSADVQILVRDPVGETTSQFGDAWISSKTYVANDVVQGSDGQFYVALVSNNTNQNPVTTTGYWTFLYSVEWNSGTTYKVGSTVTYQAITYQSLQNANINQNPSSVAAYWTPLQFAWISTKTYALNSNVVASDGILYTSIQALNLNQNPTSSPAWWTGTSAAAAASAVAAAASASSASTSASTATTQASNASTSASTATTQASNASTSASTATTQASNASGSASSASASAVSAAASFDSFDDRYLGAKASDPTLDNDGNALLTGALYFNTTANEMRVYSGAAWLAGYLPAAGYAVLGANTFTAAQEWATGASIASAGTVNLNTATGNRVHITGTTTITAVTLTRGPRTVIFDGILTLTHNATTNNLPGAANITTEAGDRAVYESDGTTVYCVSYIKASGAAVVAPAESSGGSLYVYQTYG